MFEKKSFKYPLKTLTLTCIFKYVLYRAHLYETIKMILLLLQDVSSSGLSNNTNVTVVLQDVDDLPPIFIYPDCEKQCVSTQFRIFTTRTKRVRLYTLRTVNEHILAFMVFKIKYK